MSRSRGRRVHRLGQWLASGAVLVVPLLGPAAAQAAPGASGAAASSRILCTISDARLPEISGLVATGNRFLAMNDGGDRLTVYVLDSTCRVVQVRTAAVDPYDPEDVALAADGTVWLCDTGDNLAQRATVALLAMRTDGSSAVYRLTYPDGPHDAEALLLAPDGTPYVVTKDVLGVSGVYRPAGTLQAGGTVPMRTVAAVRLTLTGTPGGPVGPAGQLLITGGAVSADGRFLALRTYTDAYVWPLAGSDVAGALAHAPRRIPMPQERQGEAISFGSDDHRLVVAGEGLPTDVLEVSVPAIAPADPPAASPAAGAGDGGGGVPTWAAAVIAAAAATVVVWIAGRLLRGRGRAERV